MKKSILSACLMALFTLTLYSFTTETVSSDTTTTIELEKPVVITIYHPGYWSAGPFGCWGEGRCAEDVIIDDGTTNAVMTNNEDGTITLDIDKTSLNDRNQEHYQTLGEYIMPEDSPLRANELEGLMLPEGTMIAAGTYTIAHEGERMIINVRIN